MTTSAQPSTPSRSRRRRRMPAAPAPAAPPIDNRKRLQDLLKQDAAARLRGTPLLTPAIRARIQTQLSATP